MEKVKWFCFVHLRVQVLCPLDKALFAAGGEVSRGDDGDGDDDDEDGAQLGLLI